MTIRPMTIRIGLIVLTAMFAAACSREQPTDEMPPTTPPATEPAPTDMPPADPSADSSQMPPATEPVPPATDETVPPQ